MIINQQWLSDAINRGVEGGDLATRAILVGLVGRGYTIDPASEKYWRQLTIIVQWARTLESNPALAQCYRMTQEQLQSIDVVQYPALIDMILVECGDDPETLDLNSGEAGMDYFTAHRGSYLSFFVKNLDVLKACCQRLSDKSGSPNNNLAPLAYEIGLAMQDSLQGKIVNIPALCNLAGKSGNVDRGCRLIKCAFPGSFNHAGCANCQGGIDYDGG